MDKPTNPNSQAADSRDEQLAGVARSWVIRLVTGRITKIELSQFKLWVAQSPAHQQAFDRERAFWHQLEGLKDLVPYSDLSDPLDNDRTSGRTWMRSRWNIVVGSSIAAGLACLVFYQDIRLFLLADHRTATGQQEIVTLPDGGIAHLNTDTAIAVSYAEGERRIELLKGEALFEVVPNKQVPFRVVSAGGYSQAVGTAFVVRTQDEQTRVSVTEGVVSVSSLDARGRPSDASLAVAKGQQTEYRRGARPENVTVVDSRVITAWTRGVIQFKEQPFATAIAELNRYRPGRIIVLGDLGGTKPVSGRFTLQGIDDAVTALANTQGLRVVRLTDYLVFIF
ncbi:putative FecR, ferric citrate sensor [Nitrospira sp. KM1]|uniref:FecR family protein n=1 Tax=Nitrospira sp. KM1 TaxID=1936990 RepID=UPI0013A71641|nr:FecR domain-containing protein [Nitrospira sp. KM1]BCA57173.1 putative FecR, ferric citrate sensor [Nitrospira sp. KM1]